MLIIKEVYNTAKPITLFATFLTFISKKYKEKNLEY